MLPQDITKGADLTLLFVDQLNEETMALRYNYKICSWKNDNNSYQKASSVTLWHTDCAVSMLYSKALSYMALSCTHTGLVNAQFLIESQNFETHGFS